MKKRNVLVSSAALSALSFFSVGFLQGCASTPKTYEMPSKNDYQGYKLIDAVDKDTVALSIDTEDKIAIVVRDIGTTSYSYLEPRYSNSMATYEGSSQCCAPTERLMGNSGLLVYKFSFTGKGNMTINLVARHKGLSTTAKSFDGDKTTSVNLKVN